MEVKFKLLRGTLLIKLLADLRLALRHIMVPETDIIIRIRGLKVVLGEVIPLRSLELLLNARITHCLLYEEVAEPGDKTQLPIACSSARAAEGELLLERLANEEVGEVGLVEEGLREEMRR